MVNSSSFRLKKKRLFGMLFAVPLVALGGAQKQNPFTALLDGTHFTSLDGGPEFYNHQGESLLSFAPLSRCRCAYVMSV